MPVDSILAEPEARNTAPCIAYACWKIQQKHPNANIVVTPSDALVINTTEYQRVLSKALSFTSNKEAIVTIGIKPSRPETAERRRNRESRNLVNKTQVYRFCMISLVITK